MRIFTARHVLPVSAPAIADGAVAVDSGRIVGVGPKLEVMANAPSGTEVRDLGDAILIPGLVNAHVHLELSWASAAADQASGDFMTWLRGLVSLRDTEDERRSIEAARVSIETLVSRGTVAVGDIANRSWILPLLAASPLQGIVFHELFGFRSADAETLLDLARKRLEGSIAAGAGATFDGALRVVLTPHAPHTCSTKLLRALADRSTSDRTRLSIHAAESREEVALLADGNGPLPEFYRERGMWDDAFRPPGLSPVEYLDRLDLLSERTLLVHGVQLDDRDISILRGRRVTVVTCPRSNRMLGVGVAPVPRLLEVGIDLALGTDSLASAPDLDLFAEMAALREEHPSLGPANVLRIATLGGARALGIDDRLGSLQKGKLAAITVVRPSSPNADPFEAVCSCPARVSPLISDPAAAPDP